MGQATRNSPATNGTEKSIPKKAKDSTNKAGPSRSLTIFSSDDSDDTPTMPPKLLTTYDKMETDSFKEIEETLKTKEIKTNDYDDIEDSEDNDSDDDNMIVMSPKKMLMNSPVKEGMKLKFVSGSPNKPTETKTNYLTKTRCIGPFQLMNKYVILLLVAKKASDGTFLYCFSNFLMINNVENSMNNFFTDMMVDSNNIFYMVDENGKEIRQMGTAKSTGNSYDKKYWHDCCVYGGETRYRSSLLLDTFISRRCE